MQIFLLCLCLARCFPVFSESSSKIHVWKVKLTFPFLFSPSSFTLKVFCCINLFINFLNLLFKSGRYKALKHDLAELHEDTACAIVYDVYTLGKGVFASRALLLLLQMAHSYCCLGLCVGEWYSKILRSNYFWCSRWVWEAAHTNRPNSFAFVNAEWDLGWDLQLKCIAHCEKGCQSLTPWFVQQNSFPVHFSRVQHYSSTKSKFIEATGMLWFFWKNTQAVLHFQDKSTEIIAPLKIKP